MTSLETRFLVAVTLVLGLACLPGLAVAADDEQGSYSGEASSAADQGESSAPASEVGSLRIGGAAGLALASGLTGFRVSVEGQYSVLELGPKLSLDVAGHLAGIFAPDVTILELVPAARVRYGLLDKLSVYGDAGLGLALARTYNSSLWGVLRFAAGAQYELSPSLSLFAEPVGANINFGSQSRFLYSMAVGALFKL